jgi:hypothetical protein
MRIAAQTGAAARHKPEEGSDHDSDTINTDIWTQFDGVALMQQLGAIPA